MLNKGGALRGGRIDWIIRWDEMSYVVMLTHNVTITRDYSEPPQWRKKKRSNRNMNKIRYEIFIESFGMNLTVCSVHAKLENVIDESKHPTALNNIYECERKIATVCSGTVTFVACESPVARALVLAIHLESDKDAGRWLNSKMKLNDCRAFIHGYVRHLHASSFNDLQRISYFCDFSKSSTHPNLRRTIHFPSEYKSMNYRTIALGTS